jgi:hypothetical protein
MEFWLTLSTEYFAFLSEHDDVRNSNDASCSITRVEFVRTQAVGLGIRYIYILCTISFGTSSALTCSLRYVKLLTGDGGSSSKGRIRGRSSNVRIRG